MRAAVDPPVVDMDPRRRRKGPSAILRACDRHVADVLAEDVPPGDVHGSRIIRRQSRPAALARSISHDDRPLKARAAISRPRDFKLRPGIIGLPTVPSTVMIVRRLD